MQHIFLPPEQFSATLVHITGADHQHLSRVLRARPGEKIVVLDGQGNAFHAELVSIDRHESTARLVASYCLPPEPAIHLTIAQALGRGDKFEEVVQHGTEAGASAFIPLRAERCVGEVPAGKEKERLARWQQIAKSAAEQSGRALIPAIRQLTTFPELIAATTASHQQAATSLFILHPADSFQFQFQDETGYSTVLTLKAALQTLPLSSYLSHLVLAVGPEGGWSPKEVSLAQKANIRLVSLGPRVLRTETAALVAISQIVYHFDV